MSEILKLNNVSKDYGIKGFKTRVLNSISLSVYEGEFLSIMGPSGAGKTTLLNLLSTLDKPTKGEIILDGIDLTKVKNKELSNIRKIEKRREFLTFFDANAKKVTQYKKLINECQILKIEKLINEIAITKDEI